MILTKEPLRDGPLSDPPIQSRQRTVRWHRHEGRPTATEAPVFALHKRFSSSRYCYLPSPPRPHTEATTPLVCILLCLRKGESQEHSHSTLQTICSFLVSQAERLCTTFNNACTLIRNFRINQRVLAADGNVVADATRRPASGIIVNITFKEHTVVYYRLTTIR